MMAHPVSGSNLCILLTIAWHSRVRPPKTCPARHCLNWIHHVPVISSYHRYSSDRRALLILCRNIRVQYFNSQSQINHIVFFEGYSSVWCFYFLQVQLFIFSKIIFKVFYSLLISQFRQNQWRSRGPQARLSQVYQTVGLKTLGLW